MLIIRDAQVDSLGELTRQRFETKLLAHVRRFFPEVTATRSDDELRVILHEGVARAAGFGIVTERDITKFVNLMFVFGRAFDSDPALPWAGARLRDDRVGPTLKINRLYLDAEDHQAEAGGLDASPWQES